MEHRQFKVGQKVKLCSNKVTRDMWTYPRYPGDHVRRLEAWELSEPWEVIKVEKAHRWTFIYLQNNNCEWVKITSSTLQNMNLKPVKGLNKIQRKKIGSNQYVYTYQRKRTTVTVYFSYDTPVVVKVETPNRVKMYKTNVAYSQTTSDHMCGFGAGYYSGAEVVSQEKINAFLN